MYLLNYCFIISFVYIPLNKLYQLIRLATRDTHTDTHTHRLTLTYMFYHTITTTTIHIGEMREPIRRLRCDDETSSSTN